MTNAQMKANRFLIWAKARKMVRLINGAVAEGKTVTIQNYGAARGFKITNKTVHLIEARKSGMFVVNGKSSVCVMDGSVGCRVTAA